MRGVVHHERTVGIVAAELAMNEFRDLPHGLLLDDDAPPENDELGVRFGYQPLRLLDRPVEMH